MSLYEQAGLRIERSPLRPAVWSPIPGSTCEYVSRVMEIVACPRSSCTSLGCVPLLNSSVAAVCLVAAWKVISGNPAFLRIFLKEVVIIQGCIGLPDWFGKTKP
jgi:hypothetical protein